MTVQGEWRSREGQDYVLIVDQEAGAVREAFAASAGRLSRLLTTPGDFRAWRGDLPVNGRTEPAAWGELIVARANTGELIWIEPRLFWEGVYLWFRSRGVDYDTPGQFE